MVTRLMLGGAIRDPLRDAHPDLTGPQIHVIATLMAGSAEGSMPTTALAQRMGTSGPTMTGIIDRLEKQGMVTRERDAEDRRLVLVKLTDAGRAAFGLLDEHFTERLSAILSVLAPEDRETFVRLLSNIFAAFDESNRS